MKHCINTMKYQHKYELGLRSTPNESITNTSSQASNTEVETSLEAFALIEKNKSDLQLTIERLNSFFQKSFGGNTQRYNILSNLVYYLIKPNIEFTIELMCYLILFRF